MSERELERPGRGAFPPEWQVGQAGSGQGSQGRPGYAAWQVSTDGEVRDRRSGSTQRESVGRQQC